MKIRPNLIPALLLMAFTLHLLPMNAQTKEDTVTVQTFTYGSDLRGWFEFPSDTNTYRKIWLYYKLKCDQGTTADNYPCGEWDYLTYTYLYDHTGLFDSTLYYQPNYEVNGETPDSFGYMDQPSWSYMTRPLFHTNVLDTTSISSFEISSHQTSINGPLDPRYPTSRQYYLWQATDLQSAGLSAGDMVGLTLHANGSIDRQHRVRIAMANTSMDSVDFYTDQGIHTQLVFNDLVSSTDTGWHQFTFSEPFDWDGTSNVLISFSTQTDTVGSTVEFSGYTADYPSRASTSGKEYALDFEGRDYVAIDPTLVQDIDSFVTISLLQYGDPAIQPQNDWIFEGVNGNGQRLLSAHLPWSNGHVYWDAGNDGTGYDRLQKEANTVDFEGRWNHWVFTKDVASSQMKIYLNGALWASNTGKFILMEGLEKFLIGSNGNGDGNYDGMIDEFAIWNRVLSASEIKDMAFRKLDDLPALANGLQAYFQFNEGESHITHDPFSNKQGILFGLPGWRLQSVEGSRYGFRLDRMLPDIKFQQGSFAYTIDTSFVVDSVVKDPVSIVIFGDSAQAPNPTDTLIKWPVYTRKVFDTSGQIAESIPIAPDHVLYKNEWPYYGEPFEVVNRYELLRYITPYGIGLNLGSQGDGEGFTWKIDVTDFAPFLADSVELSAGNNQEFLDMKFVMIKGTPPRNVRRITNVYSGSHRYNADIETDFLMPKTYSTTIDDKMARFRITNTGHGFGGNENCAEFCAKTHRVKVNGTQRFDQYLWRDNCAMNPVYPQGGTWIFSRTNWCPGAEVWVDNYEVTPFYSPGEDLTLDYDVQPGYIWNGQGSAPTWRIEAQLVTYAEPNFTLDAEMEMIISPNDWAYFKRFNPICSNPVVRIRNSGSEELTSLKITYGVKGGLMRTYDWTGNLAFLETEEVVLPGHHFGPFDTDHPVFVAKVSDPNGQQDEHPANDAMETTFENVPQYPEEVILWLKTNAAGGETHYEILDNGGNVVFSGDNFQANTLYKDTFRFDNPGCYRFILHDRDDDGLSFFASGDGSGYARLMDGFSTLKQFQPNFGRQISQSFTIGYGMAAPELSVDDIFEVYPNPTNGIIRISVKGKAFSNGVLEVQNSMGQDIWNQEVQSYAGWETTLDLSRYGQGIYLVQLRNSERTLTKTVVLK